MKVTLRFSPEELEVYKHLCTYHRNFKSIANLIKSKHFHKNDMILYELEEILNGLKIISQNLSNDWKRKEHIAHFERHQLCYE